MKNDQRPIRLAPRLAACLAAYVFCAAAGAAPSSAPPASQVSAQQNARPTSRPASQPAAPVAAAAAAPVRSQIGQTAIRDATSRPATTATSSAEADRAAGPAQGLPGYDVTRVVGALAVVLGLIFALRWVMRRSMNPAGMPGATSAVQVLTRSPLSPRQQLLLVRVGRRLIVVADCNGQLNALSELTDPDEVAALVGQLRDEKLSAASHSFGNLLGRLRRGADERAAEDDGAAEDESFPRVPHDMPEPPRERRGGLVAASEDDADPSVASAQNEIQGLMERVRLISNQFRRT